MSSSQRSSTSSDQLLPDSLSPPAAGATVRGRHCHSCKFTYARLKTQLLESSQLEIVTYAY